MIAPAKLLFPIVSLIAIWMISWAIVPSPVGLDSNILQAAPQGTHAFINVNVLPMDRELVLEDYVVVVEEGLITKVGPASQVEVPASAELIDGNGGYLMPGLTDMHMHLKSDSTINDPQQVMLFLAQGTTTIRSLGTPPEALHWRKLVREGDLVGPTIYSTGRTFVSNDKNFAGFAVVFTIVDILRLIGPILLGLILYLLFKQIRSTPIALGGGGILLAIGIALFVTKTPSIMPFVRASGFTHAFVPQTVAQALAELDRQQNYFDVDAIKVYDGLSEKQYLTLIEEAKKRDIYVSGHLLNQIPLDVNLSSGQDEIAHMDEFLTFHWIGYNLGANPDPAYAKTFDYPLEYDAIPHTVKLVADNDVVVVSNMSADEALYRLILDTEGTLAGPEYMETYPALVESWQAGGRHTTVYADSGEHRRDVEMPFFFMLTKALHDEGVTILLGTDAGGLTPEGALPSHIHREVELLVEAGFSNFEALTAGTKNAGEIVSRMGRDGNFGTVEVGQRADLILLTSNPLDSISATRTRTGVMANGRWYTQAELDQMLGDYLDLLRQ